MKSSACVIHSCAFGVNFEQWLDFGTKLPLSPLMWIGLANRDVIYPHLPVDNWISFRNWFCSQRKGAKTTIQLQAALKLRLSPPGKWRSLIDRNWKTMGCNQGLVSSKCKTRLESTKQNEPTLRRRTWLKTRFANTETSPWDEGTLCGTENYKWLVAKV